MSDPGCPHGHVWVTYSGSQVSVCKNCGASKPVAELPPSDPLFRRKDARAGESLAERISSLEADNRRMKEALEKIANGSTSGPPGMNERFDETCVRELMACRDIARATLRKEGKP